MQELVKTIQELSTTTRLSLLVSALLIFAITTTISNALTRQNERTQAATNDPDMITCAPRPACLDSLPACEIPEPESGWCPVDQP